MILLLECPVVAIAQFQDKYENDIATKHGTIEKMNRNNGNEAIAEAVNAQDKAKLYERLNKFEKRFQANYNFNFYADIIVVVLGLLVVSSSIIAGIYDEGKLAAVCGVLLIFLIGMQKAFAFDEKTKFYRAILANSASLKAQVEREILTKNQLDELYEKYEILEIFTGKNRPHGEGIQAVIDITQEIATKKKK